MLLSQAGQDRQAREELGDHGLGLPLIAKAPTLCEQESSSPHPLGPVLHCCVPSAHKHGSLEQHTFFSSQILRVRSLAAASQVLCSGYHKTDIKVWAGLFSHQQTQLEKNQLPRLHGFLSEFIFFQLYISWQSQLKRVYVCS